MVSYFVGIIISELKKSHQNELTKIENLDLHQAECNKILCNYKIRIL